MRRLWIVTFIVAFVAVASVAGHAAAKSETFTFQAEVNRLMDIIIHSLYSKKDVFLRELISNASDALDKIRLLSLTRQDPIDPSSLDIRISIDKANKLLMIRDNGVGMTRANLIDNLGTIAKSGTASFIEQFAGASDASSLIGQFGVGFYSAYLVSNLVQVVTKHDNETQQWSWESRADGSFTIQEDTEHEALGRGTLIKLHLRDDCPEYLDQQFIQDLATRYSEFINYPILLEMNHGDDTADEQQDQHEVEYRRLNDNKALWTRNAHDVSQEEYKSFYQAVFHRSFDEPMAHAHFRGEGDVEFRALLFIPGSLDPQYYDKLYNSGGTSHLRFYVRRVLISDEFELLPRYLSFLMGVVDSDSLPLNIGRETLQQHATVKVMQKKLVRKALDMMKRLADDAAEAKGQLESAASSLGEEAIASLEKQAKSYDDFYVKFGKSIKLGLVEDHDNRARLSKLLRFASTKSNKALISLDEYMQRMLPDQKAIYYLGGQSEVEIQNSPFVERLVSEGYEVLLLTDPLDEYVVQTLHEHDGKPLQDVSKEGLSLGDAEAKEEMKKLAKMYQPLTKWWTTLLKGSENEQVDAVRISPRLTTSPCVVVASNFGYSANMLRIIKSQTMGNQSPEVIKMMQRHVLEINPRHPLMQHLLALVQSNDKSVAASTMASIMYQTAVIESGLEVSSKQDFARSVYDLLQSALDLGYSHASAPMEVDVSHVVVEEGEMDEIVTGFGAMNGFGGMGGMGGMGGVDWDKIKAAQASSEEDSIRDEL